MNDMQATALSSGLLSRRESIGIYLMNFVGVGAVDLVINRYPHGKLGIWRSIAYGLSSLILILQGSVLHAETGTVDEIPRPEIYSLNSLGLIDVVKIALENSSDLTLQQGQVDFYEGRLKTSSGTFDPYLSGSLSRGRIRTPTLTPPELVTDQTDINISLGKKLRSGLTISTGVQLAGTDSNQRQSLGLDQSNSATVGLTIVFPLLRGLGRQAAAANEIAADLDYQASVFDMRHSVAQVALNSAAAYWNYVATLRGLKALQEAEERSAELVTEIQKLIDADERPAADINLIKANLTVRTSSRIAAEQRVQQALQNLATVMGYDYLDVQYLHTLPIRDDFPDLDPKLLNHVNSAQLIDDALKRRWDIRAAKARVDSARALFVGAKKNIKPQLDLSVSVGYAGLYEGEDITNALESNRAGPNYSIGMTYEWPITNSTAIGIMMQQSALLGQAIERDKNLMRSIGVSVDTAVSALTRDAMQLSESDKTVALYHQTVSNEKKKLKLGLSTLLDIISVEEQLVSSTLSNINQKASYATTLASVRYELGQLMDLSGDTGKITMQQLVGPPDRSSTISD